MDRGRPRKRSDRKEVAGKSKASETGIEKSAERKAFEELPIGFLPKDAAANMESDEVASVHKHAFRQAERFEVLKASDVEALSKVRMSDMTSLTSRLHLHTGTTSLG